MNDLLFISALGERGNRGISFAHFKENGEGPPQLQTFSWDARETHLHYLGLNLERLRWPEDTNNVKAWREQWSSAFTTTHRQVIRTSKELSVELARFARQTRELVREVYGYEAESGSLHRLHESFRTVLIQDLDVDGFADMVAQTIAYGLFSARVTGEEVLGLAHLEAMVPNTNPFLKELFAEFTKLSGHDKHQIDFDELGVSDLVDLLNTTDIEAILRDFGRQTGGGVEDPVIYFYELFLDEYDKQQRVKRGEFYTPKPVVSYIVRSVDKLLRDELDCSDGLADTSTMEWKGKAWPKVMILDPATGTGTFLETVIEVIHETMTKKWQREGLTESQIHAAWNAYVPKHLLPRLHGFELMMAPYSVAHMKLGLKLRETGYEFKSDERLRVFLTNTLEEAQDFSGRLYADFLAHEAEAANEVKKAVPVTVVIGNPPYSGVSENKGEWISRLIEAYKQVDGQPLGERKHWLNDDYVKFMRVGQWYVERSGRGVFSFITNHGYLDNPTFRGMRQSLLQTFSDFSVLDLHGNVKKGEKTPEGGKDENVFDIQQGVAIGTGVKTSSKIALGKMQHADLWGSRESKYGWLSAKHFETTEWSELTPTSPTYPMVPRQNLGIAEYESWWRISEIMPLNTTGIVTARDKFVIDTHPQPLLGRIREFLDGSYTDEEVKARLNLKENYAWRVAEARRALGRAVSATPSLDTFLEPLLYRPFDRRLIFYQPAVVWRTRNKVMYHMLAGDNLGLITVRQQSQQGIPWTLVGVTDQMIESSAISNKTKEINSLLPLYVYPRSGELLDTEKSERTPNLSLRFITELSAQLGLRFVTNSKGDLEETFGAEDVFNYIYAIFHAPTYRMRYAEFLKQDFPRLPLTSDLNLFSVLSQWGEDLVSLHLMRSSSLDNPNITFPQSGSNVMEKAKYDPEGNRIYLNKEGQHFDNVPEETWNVQVGSYQVLNKWLKDRKGRVLSTEDIEHYRKVVAALHETRQIMQEIDEVIEAHGGWPLPGSIPAEAK